MKKKIRGFTLIELLAVIVILAIIALIATPIIIGLIDDARHESFKASSYGILDSAETGFSKTLLNQEVATMTRYDYSDGVETKVGGNIDLTYNGKKPNSGSVVINVKGEIALALYEDGYCAEKKYSDSEITLSEKTKEECIISNVVSSSVVAMHPNALSQTCNPNNLVQPCLSEIIMFTGNYAPEYYGSCNGTLLPPATFPALFSLIGITYGGNGTTTFALPNLTASAPIAGVGYYMATTGASPTWDSESSSVNGNYKYFSYRTSSRDYFIGEIKLVEYYPSANNSDMHLCDGSMLYISDNPALFSIIGTKFGGNGTTTFALPNMSAVTPPVAGTQYYIVTNGTYPVRP